MDEPSPLFKLLDNACRRRPCKSPGIQMVQDILDLSTLTLSSWGAYQGGILTCIQIIPNEPTSVCRYTWPTTWKPIAALEIKFQSRQLLVSACKLPAQKPNIGEDLPCLLGGSWEPAHRLMTTHIDQTSVLMKRQDQISILRFMMYIVAQI